MPIIRITTNVADLAATPCQAPCSALLRCYFINLLPAMEDTAYCRFHFAEEESRALRRGVAWPGHTAWGEQCLVPADPGTWVVAHHTNFLSSWPRPEKEEPKWGMWRVRRRHSGIDRSTSLAIPNPRALCRR